MRTSSATCDRIVSDTVYVLMPYCVACTELLLLSNTVVTPVSLVSVLCRIGNSIDLELFMRALSPLPLLHAFSIVDCRGISTR